MWFCSYVIFSLRDEWMIERFSEAMGAALVSNNFLQILWKFHFTWKQKRLVAARNLQSIKTLLALKVSQYRKSGSIMMFSLSKPVAAPATAAYLETPCVCACPSDPHKQSRRAAPRAWSLICPLNLRLPSGTAYGEIARWPAGARTWTQNWTVPPDQRVVKVL